MKKLLTLAVTSVFILTACAGKTAHPVPQYQAQDETMSWSMIRLEIEDNQTKIMSLIPKQNKLAKNAALGVAGYFLIVPWFFMDFSDAERVEVEAFQMRNNRLRALFDTKKCAGEVPKAIQFNQDATSEKETDLSEAETDEADK